MAGLGDRLQCWRVGLRLVASMVVLGVVALPVAPAAHAGAAMATLSATSTWQTGFIARFTIVNPSSAPLTDWKLEFDLPAGESVWHTWNSVFTQYGTHYVLMPANWNRTIPPGGSATGGFRGVLNGPYVPPLNCVLNGQSYCV
jgi:cellulase/cellobiase CelA1